MCRTTTGTAQGKAVSSALWQHWPVGHDTDLPDGAAWSRDVSELTLSSGLYYIDTRKWESDFDVRLNTLSYLEIS